MTAEVEERPRLVTAGYAGTGVNGLIWLIAQLPLQFMLFKTSHFIFTFSGNV